MAKSKRAPAAPDKFKEASAWFRGRVAVTESEWRAMSVAARRQAFTIGGTQQLSVVQAVMASIQHAIDKGVTIDAWRREIKRTLGKDWTAKNAKRLSMAFQTANQTAYSTGRYYQLTDPDVASVMSYWMMDVVLDSRTSDTCNALAGTVLPNTDPWWLTHFPPFHFFCRTTVRALTKTQAKRRGITEQPPRPAIGEDWGLSPPLRAGQVWEPKREDFHPAAWAIYERNQERMRGRRAANDNDGK